MLCLFLFAWVSACGANGDGQEAITNGEGPASRALVSVEKIQFQREYAFQMGTTLTYWRDGLARGPLGKGQILPADFDWLCELVEDAQVWDAHRAYPGRVEYTAMVLDAGSKTVRIWFKPESAPFTIYEAGASGPPELAELQAAMDDVASRIEWRRAR